MRVSLSIRTYLTALVVGSVLPFVVFSGLLVYRSAADEQELIAQTVRNAAQNVATDLNRQIGGLQSLALALADSRLLQTGDLSAFQAQAIDLVQRQGLAAILYDPSGRQLLDTSVGGAIELPTDQAMIGEAVLPGDAYVSNLVTDARTGKPTVAIAVPVWRNGRLTYVLSLQILNAIAAVMREQLILPEQTVGLLDRTGSIIYRTREPDRFIGLKAPPDVLRQIDGLEAGAFRSTTRAGVPNYIAFSRIHRAGWVLATSIPRQVLFTPATNSLLRVLALGAGTLLLAGLIAWAVGRAITRPVTGLSLMSKAAAGGADHSPVAHIREVDAAAASMLAATESLHTEASSRRRAERQLVQSQKMEAVGQLTGGLAHDFNNLLAIVIGNLDMLRDQRTSHLEGRELLDGALEASLRGAELTRQMLAFARRQPLIPERCDVNQVIRVIVRLLRRTLGEDITIDLRLATDLWPVVVDRVQLEAAITNLANNARHAMPDGGRLTVTTRNTHLDEDYAAAHLDLAAGDYASIEVSDSGTGMPPEVVDRIFEPFFTTKEPGQGTGLGLSMVFGFMKQSGGHINVYSEVGEGTTFRLYLPPAHATATPVGPTEDEMPAQGNHETILAVEDSAPLRVVLTRQLSTAGYHVLEAGNAREALERLESDDAIDLLLTDIVMPGMNGHELARLAVQLRPSLKTLLTSGFSEFTNDRSVAAATRILRKPYRRDDLLRVVHEVLNE